MNKLISFFYSKDFKKYYTLVFGDKMSHFTAGFLIAYIIFKIYPSIIVPFAVTALIAFTKEYIDNKIGKSKFDYYDLLATILGSVVLIFLNKI